MMTISYSIVSIKLTIRFAETAHAMTHISPIQQTCVYLYCFVNVCFDVLFNNISYFHFYMRVELYIVYIIIFSAYIAMALEARSTRLLVICNGTK